MIRVQVIRHPKTFGVKLLAPDYDMSISKERGSPILDAKLQGVFIWRYCTAVVELSFTPTIPCSQ